jgi:hypothetical protein
MNIYLSMDNKNQCFDEVDYEDRDDIVIDVSTNVVNFKVTHDEDIEEENIKKLDNILQINENESDKQQPLFSKETKTILGLFTSAVLLSLLSNDE